MLPEITPEELSAALDASAMEVLDKAGIDGPPVDAAVLAHRLGITLAWDDRQHGRARYVRLRGPRGRRPRPTILLRPEPRRERQHWAVAHEIGEHVAHRVFARLSVDPRETSANARERVASHLASRILLPGPWFAADGATCWWDVLELKSRYTTASHELIARRMLDLAPPVIITIFDHGQVYFRRSNVFGQVPPPSSGETACWRAAHANGHPHESRDGLRAIQAWPVHEPGWKREIVRREVELEPVG
jgi:hypothetical protein